MNAPVRFAAGCSAVALLCSLAAMPAWAEKPEWAGGGKGKERKEAREGRQKEARDVRVGGYFDERDRQAARTYYAQQYEGRKSCPPGLAKKNNGCMPPGQARKYQVGQRLPADVVFHPVPHAVLVQLPPAPAGHKYVRVAADILLIAVGTSMVVDAITDLMRL
jgi:Ni/Co efflux regulator RcnB